MTTKTKFSPAVHERAVRMVEEHRADDGSIWATITSFVGKIGYTAEPLRRWRHEKASRRIFWAALAGQDR